MTTFFLILFGAVCSLAGAGLLSLGQVMHARRQSRQHPSGWQSRRHPNSFYVPVVDLDDARNDVEERRWEAAGGRP